LRRPRRRAERSFPPVIDHRDTVDKKSFVIFSLSLSFEIEKTAQSIDPKTNATPVIR
jgi:hypothetical protein